MIYAFFIIAQIYPLIFKGLYSIIMKKKINVNQVCKSIVYYD